MSNVVIIEKRKCNKPDKSYTPGAFSDKVTHGIGFIDEPLY